MGVFYIYPQFTCVEIKHEEDGKDLQTLLIIIRRFCDYFELSIIWRDKWSKVES